ncbi:MAG: hypothetical protein JWL90_35 [Chthoniobacteraceae bacterium]|nr:hypothetical protein [Chthoniobacteraceae bacterium]
MRWQTFLVCQALILPAMAQSPKVLSVMEARVQLHRLFEACRTRELQTGRFPAGYLDLEGLLSAPLRSQLPGGVEFKDPESAENRLNRKSPIGDRAVCLRLKLEENHWLNVSCTGWVFESRLYWQSEFVDLMPLVYLDSQSLKLDYRPIPERAIARSGRCGSSQIDLVPRCNAMPTACWFFDLKTPDRSPTFGEWLPSGVCEHDNVLFDVRGIIQIEGEKIEGDRSPREYPSQVEHIQIHQSARWLHLLAGTVKSAPLHAAVAVLRLHYISGATAEIPLCYGEHVSAPGDPPALSPRLSPAGDAKSEWFSLHHVRLPNPQPSEIIESFDFCAGHTTSHPFLLAVTIEE